MVQVIKNTPEYENATTYSTREKRIAEKDGNDCYLFNIPKMKQYLNIEDNVFVEDDD